jgi:hypothetical protein
MTLLFDLKNCKTEEDVKDAYIKALGLKRYTKGLVDIQTEEIWFEAKGTATPAIVMFGQLLYYLRKARKVGEHIPAFLAVIDREKAAVMSTEKALPILDDKTIEWPKSGSYAGKDLAAQIAPYIEAHYVVYPIVSHEAEFIRAVKTAISAGKIIRTPITPDNLRQVFDKWVQTVGRGLGNVQEADYAVLFFADIMHDGERAAMTNLPARLLHDEGRPVFLLKGQTYDLVDEQEYRNFWAIYDRPPETKFRHYLLERRDSLLPLDERSFKGAFYTPLHIVDKAYDQLASTLGANWQKNYIVWDMCCGVGNLEVKHSNYRNVYMSTLDQADIDVMRASRTCVGATIFQYDYLNDDIDDFGQIDYSITDKVPAPLRKAITDAQKKKPGAKKILVLINPPYAEATSSDNSASRGVDKSKKGVATTRFAAAAMSEYGAATNELFMQFVARIHQEIPKAKLAMFSKLKYLNSQALETFRDVWRAKFLDGFVVHSAAFDGLRGNFPIGFLLWDTAKNEKIEEIETTVLDKHGHFVGTKRFVNVANKKLLSTWPDRPATNDVRAIPLKGAIYPATATKDVRGTRWSDGAIGWFNCAGNDLQQAPKLRFILSSGFGSGRGFFINKQNLWQVAVMFAARLINTPTWLNDVDQFLQPTAKLTERFKSNCLVWMLFHRSNFTAGAAALQWGGEKWDITNHFIPFAEKEVDAPERFESNFMLAYMQKLTFSEDAKEVLKQGRKLWKKYHQTQFPRGTRDALKLNRVDVGWYQIRKSLETIGESFVKFDEAFAGLTESIAVDVAKLNFLAE